LNLLLETIFNVICVKEFTMYKSFLFYSLFLTISLASTNYTMNVPAKTVTVACPQDLPVVEVENLRQSYNLWLVQACEIADMNPAAIGHIAHAYQSWEARGQELKIASQRAGMQRLILAIQKEMHALYQTIRIQIQALNPALQPPARRQLFN
jgi:hypothetical protein